MEIIAVESQAYQELIDRLNRIERYVERTSHLIQDIDDEEDYYYEGIPVWQPKGAYKYSIATFIHSAKKPKFVFFWKPNAEVVDESCFSQWQPSPFQVNAYHYSCAEQYMMAEKARLFGDEEVREEIMNTSDPKLMKALGRKVRNFDPQVWDKAKYSIVLNGNYYKFTQNKEMMDFLLSTGDKILVEASPLDTIWGIGFGKENEKAKNIAMWRGQNLLGFALMEVRDEIRKLSETSSQQSKTIGTQLQKIRESINSVVAASAQSSEAFNSVVDGIKSTDEIVRRIRSAMIEQSESSQQINHTLHDINDKTLEVRSASSKMTAKWLKENGLAITISKQMEKLRKTK